MTRHVNFVRPRQHVERGMFERMIAPRFKDIGKIKDHIFIIALKLYSFSKQNIFIEETSTSFSS
jgi:hypothetical protein